MFCDTKNEIKVINVKGWYFISVVVITLFIYFCLEAWPALRILVLLYKTNSSCRRILNVVDFIFLSVMQFHSPPLSTRSEPPTLSLWGSTHTFLFWVFFLTVWLVNYVSVLLWCFVPVFVCCSQVGHFSSHILVAFPRWKNEMYVCHFAI